MSYGVTWQRACGCLPDSIICVILKVCVEELTGNIPVISSVTPCELNILKEQEVISTK